MTKNKNINLDEIMNNEKLTKEEKVQAIKDYYKQYRKELDKELNKYIAKQYIGAALEIGSAALPMGGIGKVGATVGKDLLVKNLGRKVSEHIGSGILSGGGSGTVFGFGHGLMNDENPVVSSVLGGIGGGITGGAAGAIGATIQKATRDYQLMNLPPIDDLSDIGRKNLRKFGKQYYSDYLQDSQVKDPFGNTYTFPGSQAGEIRMFNYKMLPKLKEQIKHAKHIVKSNDKPDRLDSNYFNKLYNDYKGKNYEYVMRNNQNNTGNDFYQIKEVGSNPAYSHHNRALKLEPNNIINDNEKIFNPAQVAIPANNSINESNNNNSFLYGYVQKNDWDTTPINSQEKNTPSGYAAPINYNHIFTPEEIGNMTSKEFEQNEALIIQQLKNGQIQNQKPQPDYTTFKNPESRKNLIFTREDIDKMSNEEFTKHEQEIMSQMNSVGIPYKNDLPDNIKTYEKEKSYSTNNKNGKWVTINGNHVFIED